MPRYYSREQVGVLDGTQRPPLLADGQLVNAKERHVRATINLADRQYLVGDDVILGKRPANSYYVAHSLNASVSLGTTTIALGAVGNPTKYRAAATFTTPDAPVTAAIAARVADDKLANDELQLLTFGAANPPAAGLIVVRFIYCYD